MAGTKTKKNPSSEKELPPPSAVSAGEVYIVDVDQGVGELLVELLENQFQVKTFTALSEFKKTFLDPTIETRPDLILCDAKLQDAKGLEVLRFVRQTDTTIPFILMVNQPDLAWIQEAFLAGVTDLLEKPFESFLFIDKFSGRIIQSQAARKQNRIIELLELQTLLITTHLNRLVDRVKAPSANKIRYAAPDEEKVRFSHARKSEEKLLAELEQYRIEYLRLAQDVSTN